MAPRHVCVGTDCGPQLHTEPSMMISELSTGPTHQQGTSNQCWHPLESTHAILELFHEPRAARLIGSQSHVFCPVLSASDLPRTSISWKRRSAKSPLSTSTSPCPSRCVSKNPHRDPLKWPSRHRDEKASNS